MKKTILIVGIIVLCIGAFVGLFFLLSSDVTKAGDAFFAKVKEKDIPGAYSQTSGTFQQDFTEEQFRAFLESAKFTEFASVRWSGWRMSTAAGKGTTGSLSGTMKTTGGNSIPVELDLVKEGDAWKISAIWKSRLAGGQGIPAIPTTEESSDLITRTTLAFGEAVKAGDLEQFYKTTSPDFQTGVPFAEFEEKFGVFLGKGLDFAPLKDVTPVLSNPPVLDKDGILKLEGHFPGSVAQVDFLYHFVFRDRAWKVLKITLNIGGPTPASPPAE